MTEPVVVSDGRRRETTASARVWRDAGDAFFRRSFSWFFFTLELCPWDAGLAERPFVCSAGAHQWRPAFDDNRRGE